MGLSSSDDFGFALASTYRTGANIGDHEVYDSCRQIAGRNGPWLRHHSTWSLDHTLGAAQERTFRRPPPWQQCHLSAGRRVLVICRVDDRHKICNYPLPPAGSSNKRVTRRTVLGMKKKGSRRGASPTITSCCAREANSGLEFIGGDFAALNIDVPTLRMDSSRSHDTKSILDTRWQFSACNSRLPAPTIAIFRRSETLFPQRISSRP